MLILALNVYIQTEGTLLYECLFSTFSLVSNRFHVRKQIFYVVFSIFFLIRYFLHFCWASSQFSYIFVSVVKAHTVCTYILLHHESSVIIFCTQKIVCIVTKRWDRNEEDELIYKRTFTNKHSYWLEPVVGIYYNWHQRRLNIKRR